MVVAAAEQDGATVGTGTAGFGHRDRVQREVGLLDRDPATVGLGGVGQPDLDQPAEGRDQPDRGLGQVRLDQPAGDRLGIGGLGGEALDPQVGGQHVVQQGFGWIAGIQRGVGAGTAGVPDRRTAGGREQVDDCGVLRTSVDADAGHGARALGVEVDDPGLVGQRAQAEARLGSRADIGLAVDERVVEARRRQEEAAAGERSRQAVDPDIVELVSVRRVAGRFHRHQHPM